MAKNKDDKNGSEVKKDDEELDRIARGGRGGDDVSEMLGAWQDDIDKTKDPREGK